MNYENLIDKRDAEYVPLIEKFKKGIKDIYVNGITGPFLPGVGNCYQNAKYKIAFCGMETYGWLSLETFLKEDNYSLIRVSDDSLNSNKYLGWRSNDHTTFWGFILKFLATFYKVDFNDLVNNKYPNLLHSFLWGNSNAMERYEISSSGSEYKNWELAKKASKDFDDLNHIINSCAPKVVMILYSNVDDNYFLNEETISRIYGINVSDRKKILKIQDETMKEMKYAYYYVRESDTHIFQMPHPRWMGQFSGIGFDKYINIIINDFKKYHIWNHLPDSAEDWESNSKNFIDKQSTEFKYNLIASIAHMLTENNIKMKGEQIGTLLNTNNILTSYGTPYSDDGGRGVFTLIRKSYHYFYDRKDYQTAYEIARSFVNKNGVCAY